MSIDEDDRGLQHDSVTILINLGPNPEDQYVFKSEGKKGG
jgi:hypothetical protein